MIPVGLLFQSTPSVWRETGYAFIRLFVSGLHFNPLPPCGGRQIDWRERNERAYFNPLPPCGGRRQCAATALHTGTISIHSLRVEGDPEGLSAVERRFYISIHSLRVEGDKMALSSCTVAYSFQSTPSVWRETAFPVLFPFQLAISIHSLRVEGDDHGGGYRDSDRHFNPLPPCGGRPPAIRVTCQCRDFNPLPPCGGRRRFDDRR